MSANYHSIVVTFDKDLSESVTEATCDAIRCLRHVVSVKPQEVDLDFMVARERARYTMRSCLMTALESDWEA